MKIFPPGSSPDAMLSWIEQNGFVLVPYQDSDCAASHDAISDWEVTIQGTLLDTLGRPVVNATVIVTDSSGVARSGQTNASGVYKIPGPWLNFNLLRVTSNPVGYTNGPFSTQFTIGATNHTTVIALALLPTPIRA